MSEKNENGNNDYSDEVSLHLMQNKFYIKY